MLIYNLYIYVYYIILYYIIFYINLGKILQYDHTVPPNYNVFLSHNYIPFLAQLFLATSCFGNICTDGTTCQYCYAKVLTPYLTNHVGFNLLTFP